MASEQGGAQATSQSTVSDVLERERRDSKEVCRNQRKGMKWSQEESAFLLNLRKDEKQPWAEVTRLFSVKYPGRSRGTIQVYWSTTLRKEEVALRVKRDTTLAFRTTYKPRYANLLYREPSKDDEDSRARLLWLKPAPIA